MLTSTLGKTFANNKLLSVCLAASLIVTTVAFAFERNTLSSELDGKSNTVDQQDKEIQQYITAVETQRQEIADKTLQLQKLDSQIDTLSSDIVSKEEEIAEKSQEAENLGAAVTAQQADLQKLQMQLQDLQTEIGLLEAKVQSNEKYIANLTQQMNLTPQSGQIIVSHYCLGVTDDNKGIVFPIEVEIISSGTGSLSLDVSNVQYESSFQSAVRTAAAVASKYTGESISDKDIIVRFENNYTTDGRLIKIDGPSAGAVITAMIVAGLSDKELNPSVLVTGIINPDGSVGSVGGIEDKIDAAIGFRAHMMLVPESQEANTKGILVVGVSNIKEVMKYLVTSS